MALSPRPRRNPRRRSTPEPAPLFDRKRIRSTLRFRAVPKLFNGKGIVVENGEKIVGRLVYTTEKKRNGPLGWKIDLSVDETFQRLGVGRKLVEQVISIARVRNKLSRGEPIKFIQAVVEEDNHASLQLIKKLGFKKTGYNNPGGHKEGQYIFEYWI